MEKVLIHKMIRSKRKTITLIISPDATLTVRAPFWAKQALIDSVVSKKRAWIIKKQNRFLTKPPQNLRRVFAEGEELERLTERAHLYANPAGLRFKRIVLSHARTRWGSCSPDSGIRLSWRLMWAPLEVLDYALVHELAHLKVKNHSSKFWTLVEQLLPDYKKHKKWLSDYGHQLVS